MILVCELHTVKVLKYYNNICLHRLNILPFSPREISGTYSHNADKVELLLSSLLDVLLKDQGERREMTLLVEPPPKKKHALHIELQYYYV